MNVYKDDAARQAMAGWYQRFLDELRHPYDFVDVETGAGRTHVLRAGPEDAPTLVCFHGAMGSAPAALGQVQDLVPHFRILFPDTPGQPGRSAETYLPMRGDAYGRWAVDVLDELGVGETRVLGASMGGYIALKLASHAPERVAALALWIPGGLVNASPLQSMRLVITSMLNFLFPSERTMAALYNEVFTEHSELWFDFYRDSMRHLNMDRRMPQLAKSEDFRELEAPVHVIAHELDVIFPADKLIARAGAVFPNLVDTAVIPGAKHVPPFTPGANDAVIARITRFLQEHGPDA